VTHLHLRTAPNVRELCGYVTRTGRRIRRGRLLRGGSLHAIDEADAAVLTGAHRVAVYFDLRSDDEAAQRPLAPALTAAGVAWRRAPVPSPLAGVVPDAIDEAELVSIYHRTWLAAAEPLAALVRLVGQPNAPAVIFGCALGKDRTGVVSAALLAQLDVSDEIIADDFAASACCLNRPGVDVSWLRRPPSNGFRASREVMLRLLDRVRADDSLLADRGDVARLRAQLLE
jgi:hypothetical protein